MAACQTEIEANKKLIAELEIVKHDKEAEIKIVEKKMSGLVTAMDHCAFILVAIVSVVILTDQGPALSGTADAAEGRETTAATKQHTTERLVPSAPTHSKLYNIFSL